MHCLVPRTRFRSTRSCSGRGSNVRKSASARCLGRFASCSIPGLLFACFCRVSLHATSVRLLSIGPILSAVGVAMFMFCLMKRRMWQSSMRRPRVSRSTVKNLSFTASVPSARTENLGREAWIDFLLHQIRCRANTSAAKRSIKIVRDVRIAALVWNAINQKSRLLVGRCKL